MSTQCRGGTLLAILILLSLSPAHAQVSPPQSARPTSAAANKVDAEEPAIAVRHQKSQDDWRVAETVNFRLCHRHTRTLAEEVLQKAERTRSAQQRKWFGRVGADWDRKCRIYLYPSGEAYSEATGAPINPGGGHTDIRAEEGRVFSRCIHLHGTRGLLLKGVVPHEVTHAVLAGRLSLGRVPRWADEGIAILAEAQTQIDVHFRYLPRWRTDDALFSMRTLVEMRDYPEPRSIGAFYAQSVSLVDFLTREKGAPRFAAFVRDGERDGYAASLRKHYGWSFTELERRWQRYAFYRDKEAETETANGGG
ncbi:MAG: peptidase MA family metallohydrolase [Gemmataceae bacterium]